MNSALKKWAWRILAALVPLAVGVLGGSRLPGPASRVVEKNVPVAAEPAGGYAPTFGWHADADAVAANRDPARTPQFESTPAGRADPDDADAFLWRHVRKAAGRASPWYPNLNQQNVIYCAINVY